MTDMKKIFSTGILSMLVCTELTMQAAFPTVAEASYDNPFTNIKYMTFKGDEERVYIDRKTTAFFNSGVMPVQEEYVTPKGWQREVLTINNIPVERFRREQSKSDRVVLFLHGGGYIGGLNNRYRDWGVNLADLADEAELLAVDYRIAPEYKHPAALEDALAAYEGILADGYDPEKMIVMGDSAGGNLAAALLVALRDKKLPMPKLAVLISPWTSFSSELPSRVRNYRKDMVLGEKNKRMTPAVLKSGYSQGTSVTDPYLSPVCADLTGLPKLLVTVGSDELLLDDALLFAGNAQRDGVDAELTIYKGMSHDWTLLMPELPETRQFFREITDFVNKGMK